MNSPVLLRSTKWNANLILFCDYAELVALCKVIKADVNFLVLLNIRVYRNWRRHARQSSINQTGMDFVTETSFCKTPVVDEKRLDFRG